MFCLMLIITPWKAYVEKLQEEFLSLDVTLILKKIANVQILHQHAQPITHLRHSLIPTSFRRSYTIG